MNKTVISRLGALVLAFVMLFAFSLCLTLSASADGGKRYVVDDGDFLSPWDEDALAKKLAALSDEYDMDFVVVTTTSLGGKSAEAYADDYFDYNGYGRGSDRSGVLLLRFRNSFDRYVHISTRGDAEKVFSSDRIEGLLDAMEDAFWENNEAKAFTIFADCIPGVFEDFKSYDTIWVIISIVAGLIVAAIVTGSMKKQLKSVRAQQYAGSYVRKDSFKVTESRDTFLYSTVSRVRRETSSSSSSGSHRSSSGASHGGGGRRM